jgi:FAD:protein FMN transferase
MGTAVSLEIADPVPPGGADEVFAWLREVDDRFSTYKEDSEVRRLDAGTLSTVDCSADVRAVLAACAGLWRDTDGFFDAYATGALDPSGYVKGWSVEVASARLAAAGSPNHCLNAGGDIRLRGEPSPGRPWRVGIRHPFDASAICLVITGRDLAVATSGTYERGGHVVNPRTGKPASGLCAVTVTGPDLALADAYATAALAMGRTGIDWLARLDGYESAAVTDDGELFCSPGLPQA